MNFRLRRPGFEFLFQERTGDGGRVREPEPGNSKELEAAGCAVLLTAFSIGLVSERPGPAKKAAPQRTQSQQRNAKEEK
jgi:hypothetical protein